VQAAAPAGPPGTGCPGWGCRNQASGPGAARSSPEGSSHKTDMCILGAELRLQTILREANAASLDDNRFQSPTKVKLDSYQCSENWRSS